MGNTLCGHAAAAEAADDGPSGSETAGASSPPRRSLAGASSPRRSLAGALSRHSTDGAGHPQQQQQLPEEILQALQQARQELDAARASHPARSFASDYELGQVIGSGAFATVHACTARASGQQFAVKIVRKARGDAAGKQRAGMVKKVAIMRLLSPHPHAVHLHVVYEDETTYQLVMELCSGGELFNQIVTRRQFSELDARSIMAPLLDFVAFAHSKHIVHRDLKPENILLTTTTSGNGGSSSGSNAPLRVVDFGTSDFCPPGCCLHARIGTPYYVAPEVLTHSYGAPIDVWSAGVIMYILLSGIPPFAGQSDAAILQQVAAGRLSFAAREWEAVSDHARDMICRMLVVDQQQRATADDLLKHAWFSADLSALRCGTGAAADAAALGVHIVRRLRGFAQMSHMKRLALKAMACCLTEKDVYKLRALFTSMDKDLDGTIGPKDLHKALQQVGANIGAEEVADLFRVRAVASSGGGAGSTGCGDDEASEQQQQQQPVHAPEASSAAVHTINSAAPSTCGSGSGHASTTISTISTSSSGGAGSSGGGGSCSNIYYADFLAAMLDSARVAARSDAVRTSFDKLDRDGDGYISVQDLAQTLQEEAPAGARAGDAVQRQTLQLAQQMVREVDTDNDGGVSYEEYVNMWRTHQSVVAA